MTTRVLSVVSECVPLVKTGGLADVAGALPGALAPYGVEMRTLIPGYPAVLAHIGKRARKVADLGEMFDGPAVIRQGKLGDSVLYVLDAPHLYDREGSIYLGPDGNDWPDNPERFAALSMAAAYVADKGVGKWTTEALHLHDWQAGLAPFYLRARGVERVKTLLTIHNIAFQGLAAPKLLNRLELPSEHYDHDGFEFYGQISALKAGLVWADKISTVSPTYAAELMTPEFGMGLDGMLRARRADVVGILNGIDTEVWTSPYRTAKGKSALRKALRKTMGLPDSDGPLCVVISRLTEQKGLDLLLEALPALLARGGQLALLGSGDAGLERAFHDAASAHADVAVRIGYDEKLASDLIAGGDVILVPSRFEPCGLTQLYGLRFGTLPLVSLTGGLADTVISANPAAMQAKVATGFQFHPITAQALELSLTQMCDIFGDATAWAKMQRNAMAQPVGWDISAQAYADLFKELVSPT